MLRRREAAEVLLQCEAFDAPIFLSVLHWLSLAAVTMPGSWKSWTLNPKLEEVPVASSMRGHAPHTSGVHRLVAGNSLSLQRVIITIIFMIVILQD